jgi:hypothetical protein
MVMASAARLMDVLHQRTSVTNTDPPYEVGDIPGPADGFVQPPDANTFPPGPPKAITTVTQKQYGDTKGNQPFFGRLAFYLPANIFCYVPVRFPSGYQRFSYRRSYCVHDANY